MVPPRRADLRQPARAEGEILMGRWYQPDNAIMLMDVLGDAGLDLPQDTIEKLVDALQKSGRVVRLPFFVPSLHDLHASYRRIAEADWRGRTLRRPEYLPLRWVMCFETIVMLKREHGTKAMHFPVFTAADFVQSDGDIAILDLSDRVFTVMEAAWSKSLPPALEAGRLFDMPIRMDPAARRPMWEFVDD